MSMCKIPHGRSLPWTEDHLHNNDCDDNEDDDNKINYVIMASSL